MSTDGMQAVFIVYHLFEIPVTCVGVNRHLLNLEQIISLSRRPTSKAAILISTRMNIWTETVWNIKNEWASWGDCGQMELLSIVAWNKQHKVLKDENVIISYTKQKHATMAHTWNEYKSLS